MQEIDERRVVAETPLPAPAVLDFQSDFDADDLEPRPIKLPSRRRVLTVAGVLLGVALLVLAPPLLNVNRFRRQIARSVSASLGRPVRIDSVALTVLPMPGFTLKMFVVGEDPAFGAEPVIRADSVRLTLRLSSLWRRRVEFSRITLDDPSVNLVHLPDGRWNLESILLQAARVPAAPTGQKAAGDQPRFPYIEATGARVNVKQGLEKLPISLTDAKFALWLPESNQWRLRLSGHPTRTDAAPADTGTFELAGTLGKASTVEAVPVDLDGAWSAAPLGAVSEVLMGGDAGLRGEMTLDASVHGTVGANTLESRLRLRNLRRSEFVPDQTLDVDARCSAGAAQLFHALHSVRCVWPGDRAGTGLELSAEMPDVFQARTATGRVAFKDVRLSGLLDGLRVASARVSTDLSAGGLLTGAVSCCVDSVASGSLAVADARLALGSGSPLVSGDLAGEFGTTGELVFAPVAIDLGGTTPATLQVTASRQGYGARLTGTVLLERVEALARALPQFGDGLVEALPAAEAGEPIRVDLQSARVWGGAQTWEPVAAPVAPARKRKARHAERVQ